MENKKVDAEKIASYILITATILAAIIYIADIKERIAVLETKMEMKCSN